MRSASVGPGQRQTNQSPSLCASLRHCVISDAGAKYHFLSRVRPLFLYRHHGSHARSRVSSLFRFFLLKNNVFWSFLAV